jgi:hypothetical protein
LIPPLAPEGVPVLCAPRLVVSFNSPFVRRVEGARLQRCPPGRLSGNDNSNNPRGGARTDRQELTLLPDEESRVVVERRERETDEIAR